MKITRVFVGTVFIIGFGGMSVWSQQTPAASKVTANAVNSIQTFYLANVTQPDDGHEIYNAIRVTLPSQASVYFDSSREALIVRGDSDILAMAQKLISDLDRTKKAFRLTYTISEVDGGKRVASQHFAMMVTDGQKVTLKQGSKVPVATGSNPSGAPTQFQYFDVGTNFDATLIQVAGGGLLKTRVERTSVAEDKLTDVLHQPVIRQATLEGTSVLTLGKPLMLGSLDIPGSMAHLDIEVMMEVVK